LVPAFISIDGQYGRIANLSARCATKANPVKAGDAKPRGYSVLITNAKPVEPPKHTTEEDAILCVLSSWEWPALLLDSRVVLHMVQTSKFRRHRRSYM
jgi:hypothetical protein